MPTGAIITSGAGGNLPILGGSQPNPNIPITPPHKEAPVPQPLPPNAPATGSQQKESSGVIVGADKTFTVSADSRKAPSSPIIPTTPVVKPVTSPASNMDIKTSVDVTIKSAQVGRAIWLQSHQPPLEGTRAWADWVRNNPYATDSEKAAVKVLEKFNYDITGVTQEQVIQAFSPTQADIDAAKAKYSELAKLSDAEIRNILTTQALDLIHSPLVHVDHTINGINDKGEPIKVLVTAEQYWDIVNSNPIDRLPLLIDAMVLPKGTSLVGNGTQEAIDIYNQKFGTKLTLEFPYAVPSEQKTVTDILHSEDTLKIFRDAGAIISSSVPPIGSIARSSHTEEYWKAHGDKIDLAKAISAGISEKVLKDAGFKDSDIKQTQAAIATQSKARDDINIAIKNLIYAPYYVQGDMTPDPEKFTEKEVLILIQNNVKPQTLVDAGVSISAVNNTINGIRIEFETNILPQLPKELQDSYKSGMASGDLSQFQSKLNEYNTINQEKIDKYNSALKVLDDGGYRSTKMEYPEGGAPFESYTTEGAYGYNTSKYLVDTKTSDYKINPESLKVVSALYPNNPDQISMITKTVQGYLDAQKQARDYVKEFIASYNKGLADKEVFNSQIKLLGFDKQFQDGTLFNNKDILTSLNPIKDVHGGFEIAQGVHVSYNDFWNNISSDKQQQLADAIANDPRKSSTFAAIMENYNINLKEQGLIGTIVPIVGMFLAPEVFIPMFAIQSLANVIAPYTVSNKAIINQINGNLAYYNSSASLTPEESNILAKALKSNDFSIGNNPLQSFQALSDAQKQKVATDVTRQQLGLTVSTMDKVIAGAMVVASILPFTSPLKLLPNVAGKIGEVTVRGSIMGAFATNIGLNWNKMDITSKIENIALMVAAPVANVAVGGIKTLGAIIKTTTTEGGILPAGLKTGGLDLALVKVPDLFKGIEGKVSEIIANTPPEKQADAIRELLNPENRIRFDAYMNLANSIDTIILPDNLIKPNVEFTNVEVLNGNLQIANGFKAWLQANNKDIYIGGSTARAQQLMGVDGLSTPHDFDFYIKVNSRLTPEQAVKGLADTIKQYAPNANVKANGTKLNINGVDTSDIHVEGYAGNNPFGWATIPKTVIIDGVAFEDIHQLLLDLLKAPTTPEIGKSAGLLFPSGNEPFPRGKIGETVFGTIPQRIKDIIAGNVALKGIADALESSNPELAKLIRDNLYTIQSTPIGKPLASAGAESIAKATFLDMVGKAQQDVLTKGIDATVVDPQTGTLIRIASPASKVVQGVLYNATRDIKPFIEAAKQGYFEVGKLLGVKNGELTIPKYYIGNENVLKGQELVDKIASDYKLESKPTSRYNLWERFIKERGTEAFYDVEKDVIKLKSNAASVILHELVHPEIDKHINLDIAESLNKIGNLPIDSINLVEKGLKVRLGQELDYGIVEGFQELSTIEYVKRISGYDDIEYRSMVMDKLNEVGDKYNITGLANKVDDISQKYVNSLNVKYITNIPKELKTHSNMEVIRQVYQTDDGATALPEMNISGGKIQLDANGIPLASQSGYVKVTMPDGKELWITKNNADVITRTISNGIDASKYITFNMKTTNAERGQLFASPDAAFDFMLDREKGEFPPDAGIIAIRTTPLDTSNPEMIGIPFRYEHDAKGNTIVYDERIVANGTKIYSTPPTDYSLSGKGKTDGATGETVTYYPRNKITIPMLWFATDSAKNEGLSAPTLTQDKAINWLAFKSMIANTLHPHVASDIQFTWGDMKGIKGSLLNFYKDTFEWKGKSEKEIVDTVNKETDRISKEAVDNLNNRGALKDIKPEDTQRLIDEEVSKIIADRVKNVMAEQKVMEELTKAKGDDIVGRYTLDVQELLDGLTKATLVGGTSIGEDKTQTVEEINTTVDKGATGSIITVEGIPKENVTTKRAGVSTKATAIIPTKETIIAKPTEITTISKSTIKSTIPSKITEATKPAISSTVTKLAAPTIGAPTTKLTTEKLTPPPTISTPSILTVPPDGKLSPKIPIAFITEPFNKEKIMSVYKGRVAWYQGQLRQGKQLKEQWYLISPPYKSENDIVRLFHRPDNAYAVKGIGAAFKTIQALGGEIPRFMLDIDWGYYDLTVSAPAKVGDKPALKFKKQPRGAPRSAPLSVKMIRTIQ